MNIQRFTAATSREALAQARQIFGESTLILSNRTTESGVEIVATAEDTLAVLDRSAPAASTTGGPRPAPNYKDVASQAEQDAAQMAMSTLSFQDYVRERMIKRRHEAAQAAAPQAPETSSAKERAPVAAPAAIKTSAVSKSPAASAGAVESIQQGIERELSSMKEMIEDRFNTLHWLGQARQDPIQSNLMLKLIRAGYSPTLSRKILERMPERGDAQASIQWVMDVIERNLRTDAGLPALHEEGGIFALIGATGVGKTTTAAKLAGLCARQFGPGSVGLITLDTYRVGAQEQLRAYGKMLGVVAHLAHDRAALEDLLGLLSNKKMVLIDTTGLAPRDPRKREMMELLDIPQLKKLLVLSAGGHGDTLDDTVANFKSPTGQQTIISKIDEAVKLGPVIDAAIRHQLVIRGVTTGQRVPEDWESAHAANLVRASMRTSGSSPYDPKMGDLGFIFSHASGAAPARGFLDA